MLEGVHSMTMTSLAWCMIVMTGYMFYDLLGLVHGWRCMFYDLYVLWPVCYITCMFYDLYVLWPVCSMTTSSSVGCMTASSLTWSMVESVCSITASSSVWCMTASSLAWSMVESVCSMTTSSCLMYDCILLGLKHGWGCMFYDHILLCLVYDRIILGLVHGWGCVFYDRIFLCLVYDSILLSLVHGWCIIEGVIIWRLISAFVGWWYFMFVLYLGIHVCHATITTRFNHTHIHIYFYVQCGSLSRHCALLYQRNHVKVSILCTLPHQGLAFILHVKMKHLNFSGWDACIFVMRNTMYYIPMTCSTD